MPRSALDVVQRGSDICVDGDEFVEPDYVENFLNIRLKCADMEVAVHLVQVPPNAEKSPQACAAEIGDVRAVYYYVAVAAP